MYFKIHFIPMEASVLTVSKLLSAICFNANADLLDVVTP